MIKKILISGFLVIQLFDGFSQERIFSIAYAKNYIYPDSTNYTVQLDFNRNPSKSEAAGTYWLLNEAIGGNFGVFIRPTADVNVGSGTTVAPNNISISLPAGIAYDGTIKGDIFSFSVEVFPEIVSDKSLNNHLRYISKGLGAVYSHTSHSEQFVIDISSGLYWAHGTRLRDIKSKLKNKYGRFLFPVFLNSSILKSKDSSFYKIKLNAYYKYNNVFKDDPNIITDKTMNYFYARLDFYVIKNLGISIVYNNGNEEPLFKKVKSFSFGLTLAR
ncbi:MAG: hypothetical protein ACT4OJ_13420 [Bacteroidota bacterium]